MPVSAVKGGTTTFNKYLILNENAHVPDADFTFKIAPGTPVPADSASGMPAIYAGIGAPTVFEAAFSPDDEAITFENGNSYSREFIAGKPTKVYNDLGGYLSVVESRWGFLFIVLVPCFLIFIYEVYALIVEIKYGAEEN